VTKKKCSDTSSTLIYKLSLDNLLFSTHTKLSSAAQDILVVTDPSPVPVPEADADADADSDVAVGSASHASASVVGLDVAVGGTACVVVSIAVVVEKDSVVLLCVVGDVGSGTVNVTVVSSEVVDMTALVDAVVTEVKVDAGAEMEAVDVVKPIEVEETGAEVVVIAKVEVLVEVLALVVVVNVVGVEAVVLDLVDVVDSTEDVVVVVVAGLSGSSNTRIGPASNGTTEPTAEVLRSVNL